MARMRTLKPEFWTDSRMVQLRPLARLLYMGMWNFADDDGVLDDDPLQIKLRILPAENVDADELVRNLIDCGAVRRAVTPDGAKVLVIPKFKEHQRPNRPSPSEHGDPSTYTYESMSTHGASSEDSRSTPSVVEGSGGVSSGGESRAGSLREPAPSSTLDRAELESDFVYLWESWPKRHGTKGSKKKAHQRFRNLTEAQRRRAVDRAGQYEAWCKVTGTPPQDCVTWLNQDRFDEDWAAALIEARRGPPNVHQLPRTVRDELTRNAALDEWARRKA